MKAAVDIAKEIITVKYFAGNCFVGKFFKVGMVAHILESQVIPT